MGAGSGGQNPPEILNSPLLAEKLPFCKFTLLKTGLQNLNAFNEPAMTDTEHSAAEAAIETHPLAPFLPANGRLLMLGSFPPPKNALENGFLLS